MSLFKSSAIFAASALMAAGLAQVASAAVIIGPHTFDSPAFNLGNVNGQQTWVGSGTGATVTNADGNAAPALFIDNTQSPVFARLPIPAPYNTDTTQTMRVKYDIMGTLDSSNFAMPMVQIGDLGGTDYVACMIEGMADGAGANANKFRLNGGAAFVTGTIASDINTWYTVTVDLSFGSKTYNVSITDGTNTGTATNVPFWYDSVSLPVPKLGAVQFMKNGGAGNYPNDSGYIDNVSVEMVAVPEPTTAAVSLLGLGALALRRRK